jgi:spore maturation protein CgeB
MHDTIPESANLRILAPGETWHGSNSYSYMQAFRRAGHSVSTVSDEWFIAKGWRSTKLKVLRRLIGSAIIKEYNDALVQEAEVMRPHLFFVFKGAMVTPETIETVRRAGAVAINFWPDVSVMAHGRLIPCALPRYDWVYTTKTFGIEDMRRQLGVVNSSFVPHCFDPEVHRRVVLPAEGLDHYACDVSFIGTWSPKKQQMLESLMRHNSGLRLRIWGAQWKPALHTLSATVMGRPITGTEYAKAISASKINLGILSEGRSGSSDGDKITSRTFEIPAIGSFMLHEQSDEIGNYFVNGQECATFSDADDMAAKVAYYLSHDDERMRIAAAGHARALSSGYSYDDAAARVVGKARQILTQRTSTAS